MSYVLALIVLSVNFTSCDDTNTPDNGDGSGGTENENGLLSNVAEALNYNEWAYVDFATNTTKVVEIETQASGGFAGTYTTNLEMMSGMVSNEEVTITIIDDTSASGMSAYIEITGIDGGSYGDLEFSTYATVENDGEKWILTGIDGECEGGSYTWTTTDFVCEVDINEGGDFTLTGNVQPGAMPMTMDVTCIGLVGQNALYVPSVDETSFDWDIAFHKYDVRTNGCEVVKTSFTNLEDVTSIPTSGFEADTEDLKVIVDMSGMMSGVIGYHYCSLNATLCDWITATATGTMPPYTYELNNEVYVIKNAAGKYYKVKFTDMTNDTDEAVCAAYTFEEITE
ncbi:MAG: HmuY family protein [bacterium]